MGDMTVDKLGVGFVGAGWMGSTLLKRLTERDDIRILALYESNLERGTQVLYELGLSPDIMVDNYQSILENPDIRAVWIVSPNSYHAQQAIAAMNAGKHVFCEKPCATTFYDFCAEIQTEKANPNLITYVDYILNFDSMECRLKDMIAHNEFGTITQVQVNYRHPINISGDKAWKLDKTIMGDAIGMGINHSISVMVNIMSPQTKPVSVFARSMPALMRGFEADPIWNIMVGFDNGATGFCFGNIDNCNGYDAYHNVFGTEGGFIFDSQLDQNAKLRYWSEKNTKGQWVYPLDAERCKIHDQELFIWPKETTTPDSGNVVEHQTGVCVEHFVECIKTGKKSPLSFVNAAVVAEIGWAAQMSANTHTEIRLPLDIDAVGSFFGGKND
jgi:predicted dehydrogenase